MNKHTTYLFLLLAALVSGCQYFSKQNPSSEPIARVYESYLYKDDLLPLLPPNVSKEDSGIIVSNFIDNWIKEQVIIYQANNNLSEMERDFDQRVEDYRNSLLIYSYEQKLIQQKLETDISQTDLEAYYNSNEDNFILTDCAIRAYYIKIDSAIHDPAKIKAQMVSDDANEIEELKAYCQSYAVEYFFDENRWINCSEISAKVVLTDRERNQLSKEKSFVSLTYGGYSFYIYVLESIPADSKAPFKLVEEGIKERIINKRKVDLINQMRIDLYNEALNKKNAEIL